jgi:hypothetical protein
LDDVRETAADHQELMRNRYVARSEKLDPDQLQLAQEEVAQSLGAARAVVDPEAAGDRRAPACTAQPRRPCRRISLAAQYRATIWVRCALPRQKCSPKLSCCLI